jgi:hypothetical protein
MRKKGCGHAPTSDIAAVEKMSRSTLQFAPGTSALWRWYRQARPQRVWEGSAFFRIAADPLGQCWGEGLRKHFETKHRLTKPSVAYQRRKAVVSGANCGARYQVIGLCSQVR